MGRSRRAGQKPTSDAPIDRFTWKDGDVQILYDPSKDPNAKTDEQIRAERRARAEEVEADVRGEDTVQFRRHTNSANKGFNKLQPRWPKGSPLGGQWRGLSGNDLERLAWETFEKWGKRRARDRDLMETVGEYPTYYRDINGALRTEGSFEKVREEYGEYADEEFTPEVHVTEALDTLFSDPGLPTLDQDAELLRGMRWEELSDRFDAGTLEGYGFDDPGFTSLTPHSNLAEQFGTSQASRRGPQRGVIASVLIPKGTKLLHMPSLGFGDNASEYLLNRGSKFRITRAWLDGEQRRIEMEVIPD